MERTFDGTGRIVLLSPDNKAKRLLISSILHKCTISDIAVVNGRTVVLAPLDVSTETADDTGILMNSMDTFDIIQPFSSLDKAFREEDAELVPDSLSLQLISQLGTQRELCARLEISGILADPEELTDSSVPDGHEQAVLTFVIVLDAENVMNGEPVYERQFTDVLRRYADRRLSVVTAVGNAERYFAKHPQGGEQELIEKTKSVYSELSGYIDGNITLHRERAYSAANRDITALYDGAGNISENPVYEPWQAVELLTDIVFMSASANRDEAYYAITHYTDLLRRRIGLFERSSVRARIDVEEARRKLATYIICKYPLDNSVNYFGSGTGMNAGGAAPAGTARG